MLLWDGFGLQSMHTGIGTYAFSLKQELLKLGIEPKILKSVPSLAKEMMPEGESEKGFKAGRIKPLSLWKAHALAEEMAKKSNSSKILYHGLSNYNVPMLSSRFSAILTVHDLIPLIEPSGVSRSLALFLSYQLPRAIRRADAIVCVSDWTANTLQERFIEARGKTLVIKNGRPKDFFERSNVNPERLSIITVSRGEVYKRLELIPKILEKLPANIQWHLVTDSVGAKLMPPRENFFVHQGLSEEKLAALWKSSDIFIHPSRLEGYCLPAATALSHGLPSLYTKGSGIDEVLGDAGYALQAEDSSQIWAEKVLEILEKKEAKGHGVRAQWQSLPTWADAAKQLSQVYDKMGL